MVEAAGVEPASATKVLTGLGFLVDQNVLIRSQYNYVITSKGGTMSEKTKTEMWAVVELMGHDITAGIIRPGELGGLLRIDVPIDDTFRTEYLGEGSIFRIRIVSEEIARVYAAPERGIVSYDQPIVPRAQYEEALQKSRAEMSRLQDQIKTLSKRLTAINALPEPE